MGPRKNQKILQKIPGNPKFELVQNEESNYTERDQNLISCEGGQDTLACKFQAIRLMHRPHARQVSVPDLTRL